MEEYYRIILAFCFFPVLPLLVFFVINPIIRKIPSAVEEYFDKRDIKKFAKIMMEEHRKHRPEITLDLSWYIKRITG